MKTALILITSLASALAAGSAAATTDAQQPALRPLRPISACLDLNRATEQYITSDRSLIVRAGPNHFRIDLKTACPGLRSGNSARLVPSDTPDLVHRMCGDLNEKVVTRDGLPCAVKSVTPIDAVSFKAAEQTVLDANRTRRAKN